MELNATSRLIAATSLEEKANALERITNSASYDHSRKQAIERVKNGQGTPADEKLIVEQLKRWAQLGKGIAKSEAQKALASTEVTATDYHKLKELAQKFEQQLKKEGAPGVEVTFISDDEINIFSENKHSFERAKQVLKKVPGLKFKNEEVDNDPDFDGPQYHAWYKF